MDALPYYRVPDFECRIRRNPFTLHSLSSMRIFDVMPDMNLSVFLLDSKVGKLS